MIEVVGKDGMIYHVKVACPASDIDHGEFRDLSDVEQRFLKLLEPDLFNVGNPGCNGFKRPPRIVRVK